MQAAKGLVANSLNYAVADQHGSIMYGAFQPFPCRTHLDRAPNGEWGEGSNPQLLLDGTRFGGFTLPFVDRVLDEASTVPDACVIPYVETPHVVNPKRGYVVTANNDLGGMSFDNSITNDGRYFGGPWNMAFRANTIATELEKAIADGTADVKKMSEIQGNVDSTLGALLLDDMLASVAYAKALAAPTDAADQRIALIYATDAAAMDEVVTRLSAWQQRGLKALSGVETFYNQPDATEREDAVATMIFNAWMSRFIRGVFDDEGMPGGLFRNSGTHAQLRALVRFLDGRGAGNALNLASFNEATGESAYFDVLQTPEIETSHEVIVAALADALAFLRSTPEEGAEPGTGGFATNDMTQWLWGLRHYVRFQSLLAGFLDDDQYAPITNSFAITTNSLPLVPGLLPDGDPRKGMLWFPRHADQYAVDAGNPGTSGVSFGYDNGPVMRMVVALYPDRVEGVNIIPGGQSAIKESEYFHDQARLWLANETTPMRFSVDQVVSFEGATRETYAPAR
jgi:acyl-homoserine lactone acylase PvdQ